MTRIALVGEGPWPGPAEERLSFAQLRWTHFAAALAEHAVERVDCRDPDAPARIRRMRPDAVVSAGSYGPTQVALSGAGDAPLWLDLPGDPFAEAQAAAAVAAQPAVVAAQAAAVYLPALARADAFSTISGPSRHALLGALGALGRLALSPLEDEWAWIVPVIWDFGLPPQAPRPRQAPLRVVLAGSFNTWFDDETLLTGLLLAMDQQDLVVDVVGGGVIGHHTDGYARFVAGAQASVHAARFTLHGWVPHHQLGAVLGRGDVGICLDRPGYEAEFGSRTRLLLFLHQGLSVIATPRCALARQLAEAGLLIPVPPQDPAALAQAIGALPGPVDAHAWCAAQFGLQTVTAPLRAWAQAPRRRPPAPAAAEIGVLIEEKSRMERELRAVRESPTFRLLNRLHRWLHRWSPS